MRLCESKSASGGSGPLPQRRLNIAGVELPAEAGHVDRVGRHDQPIRGPDPNDHIGAQALLAMNAYNDVWHAGLFLFGLHLLVVGYLAFKSGYVPKLIAVLVAIDGLSYVVDTFGTVLPPPAIGPTPPPTPSSASYCWDCGS